MGVEMSDFIGQVAIITGGASGIGLALTRKLVADGAVVVIADLDERAGERAAAELGGANSAVVFRRCDVTSESEVAELVGFTHRTFGRLDILVNNAGTTVPSTPLWETGPEVVERMWRIHHFAPYLACREAVPLMREAGYGRIVNVASVAGKEGNPGSSAYSAAKGAVIAMTKSLGKELATSGVIVNAVTPGVIETPLIASATPSHIEKLLAKIPMNRAGKPEEVAELIAWLVSSKCSFTTGSVVDASGGRTSY